MEEKYDLHSEFDIEKHKKTFPHYLEVIIGPTGKVAYAVPSHQYALIAIACKKYGVDRNELDKIKKQGTIPAFSFAKNKNGVNITPQFCYMALSTLPERRQRVQTLM